MSEPVAPRVPSAVVGRLPAHAGDLAAAVVVLLTVVVVGRDDLDAGTAVVLGALALAVRGLVGLGVAWVVDHW